MDAARIESRGPFSLEASARFVAGFGPAGRPDAATGPLRLGFVAERTWEPTAVRVEQEPSGVVTVVGPDDAKPSPAVVAQVGRMLSLDVDGSGLDEVGSRDPVVADLLERMPGLRPVCFGSPYEAAVWALLSNRVRVTRAAAVRRRIVAGHGTTVAIDGTGIAVFPAPDVLHRVAGDLGLPEVKVPRLRAVADAARDGVLDGETLRSRPAAESLAALREIPGIGPFSAELILIRGAGHPDLLPVAEQRLHTEMTDRYGTADPTTVAEMWRPYRSRVSFLLRADRERRTGEMGGGPGHPACVAG
ncbi:DNA-3-methyladenine glycosylase II [Pseudonocardia sediminis]|uniref:DNA-3-methyladenine glycosylase II n=1 Tax=Pseudonocardia sediminis TaxID=1397368 RepID=A0A4Q7UZ99_PSEST|nr:DNA-3-methyladenine glycosylase [Pseudonocardia sediminis]RZT85529.1 DNA-3-methyladenine glycosylase II [Pseudonocardia sediminis]